VFSSLRGICSILLLVFLPGCGDGQRGLARAPGRVVFTPFEYIGSTPALAWTGVATAAIAAAQAAAFVAPTVREAQSIRAGQVVSGVITDRAGELHLAATLRDEAAQKTVQTFEVRGGTPLALASALAKQIAAKPRPYGSSNPDAVRELYSGRPAAAIAADPSFGAAHVAHIEELLRTGRRDDVPKAVEAARGAKLTELDRAMLARLVATTPKDRSDSLLAMAKLHGHDLGLWRAAADAALIAKDHAAAAEALQKAAELDPNNVGNWNIMAYAHGFAGNLEGAEASIAEYRRIAPQDANAYDSLGEVYFYHGRFAEAEENFLKAFKMNDALLGGGEMYRAALARFLAGDVTKADQYFKQYLQFRQRHNDPSLDLREAVWLYTTGRGAEARAKAASVGSAAAKTQTLLWDLADGKVSGNVGQQPAVQGWNLLFARKYAEASEFWRKAYENSSIIEGNQSRVALAWALSGLGREAEARALLERWPLPPQSAEAGFSSILINKAVQLRAGKGR
jgi:tetratricopeptide (TPR) repeat protein